MQYFPLKISPTVPDATFNANGSGFWYESVSSLTGDNRIICKSEQGDEITLKPGQSVRLPQRSNRWYVKSIDGESTISGNIMIGDAEFNDNNATISAPVSVNNFPATQAISGSVSIAGGDVEIKNDSGNPIPVNGTVAISGEVEIKNDTGNPLTVQENILSITGYYNSTSNTSANTAIQIVAPASNTNGVIIHSAKIYDGSSDGCTYAILAKASAPANPTDGVPIILKTNTSGVEYISELKNKIKIPAGQGLYLITSIAATNGKYIALTYTVL